MPHTLLRAIGTAPVEVQKGGQEIRLIIVIVESIVKTRVTCRRIGEERIEPRDEAYVATEFVD